MTESDRTLARYTGPRGPWGPLLGFQRLRDRIREQADAVVDKLLGEETVSRLARLEVHRGQSGVDPFGFDPAVAKWAVLGARAVVEKYFRAEVFGIERVPAGRVMLISNHSGQIPLDGVAISVAMLMHANPPRYVRPMVEKWTATLPFISEAFQRWGQIVGVPENCIRALEMNEAVLVFPEGVRGVSKTFDKRYKLTDFGLGFMRMALEAKAPIVPVAVIGAEEQYISVANFKALGRLVGAPALPIIPQMILPGGFLPLPTKYRIYFGDPLEFRGDPDDEDAVIEEKAWVVKSTIQSMINRGIKERKNIFF